MTCYFPPFMRITPDQRKIRLKAIPQEKEMIALIIFSGLLINTPITPAANQATAILARNSAIRYLCPEDIFFTKRLYHNFLRLNRQNPPGGGGVAVRGAGKDILAESAGLKLQRFSISF